MSCVVNITELSVCCYLSLSFEKRKDRAVEVLAVVPEMLSQQHQLIAIAACAVQLQEPLLLVAAFALLFALTIAYNRCDLTITTRCQVAGLPGARSWLRTSWNALRPLLHVSNTEDPLYRLHDHRVTGYSNLHEQMS